MPYHRTNAFASRRKYFEEDGGDKRRRIAAFDARTLRTAQLSVLSARKGQPGVFTPQLRFLNHHFYLPTAVKSHFSSVA